MTKRSCVVAAAVLGLFVWTACTGDDPVATEPSNEGAEGQPCFANQSCLAKLTCVSGVCLVADAGSGGTSSSSSSSSSSGSTVTSNPTDCEQISGDKTAPGCARSFGDTTCGGGEDACCAGLGCQMSGETCGGDHGQWLCLTDEQCGSTGRCCMQGSVQTSVAPIQCFAQTVVEKASPACEADVTTCMSGELELCTPMQTTCASGKTCNLVAFPFVGADGTSYVKAIGVCQ